MIQQAKHTLPRANNSPLSFTGRMLDSVDGEGDHLRWYILSVYQTTGGKYVVHVQFKTRWRGESDHDWVQVVEDASGVAKALREYDVLPPGRGFPPGYEARQAALRAALQRDYDDLVTEILDADLFTEEIE